MLKPAITYQVQLSNLMPSRIFDSRYKFYTAQPHVQYTPDIDQSSWDNLQVVSVDNIDVVHGYLSASINRLAYYVSGLSLINFKPHSTIFSKDMSKFVLSLFLRHNYNKIVWSVVCGNPAQKMYEKFCKKYNGKEVGTFKQHVRLIDGKLYDEKYYEILKEDFEKAIGQEKLIRLRIANGW